MRKNQIIFDEKTLIEYIKKIDNENINKYLILIKTLQNQSIHDMFRLSDYVFKKMEDKGFSNISNKYSYFSKSILSNIHKLNDLQVGTTNPKSTEVPSWLNQNIEKKQPSKISQEEMELIINEFK